MKKVIVTLNVNDYQPAIRDLTYPLFRYYANKIHADFVEITERKFPDWPIVMEKFQCRDIAKSMGADWCLFFDSDALISPEMFDITTHLSKDTVCFNGKDISGVRSFQDKYFLRDGRGIGACDWFCASSDWVYEDLYSFPEDLTFEAAKKNIFPSIAEQTSGMFKDDHLIDDYTLSRNIARFGFKHDTAMDVCGRMGIKDQYGRGVNPYFFHLYNIPESEKIDRMLAHLSKKPEEGGWGMMSVNEVMAFRSQWNLDAKANAAKNKTREAIA